MQTQKKNKFRRGGVTPPLQNQLQNKLNNAVKITIMAVGSELRADDAAGILTARELEKNKSFKNKSKFQVIYGHTAPENFTGVIKKFNPSHIIMIDSADMGKKYGSIAVIEKEKINTTSFSTHSLPIKIMVDYMKEMIGAETVIIGIQPKNISFGESVSTQIAASSKKLAQIIKSVLLTKI